MIGGGEHAVSGVVNGENARTLKFDQLSALAAGRDGVVYFYRMPTRTTTGEKKFLYRFSPDTNTVETAIGGGKEKGIEPMNTGDLKINEIGSMAVDLNGDLFFTTDGQIRVAYFGSASTMKSVFDSGMEAIEKIKTKDDVESSLRACRIALSNLNLLAGPQLNLMRVLWSAASKIENRVKNSTTGGLPSVGHAYSLTADYVRRVADYVDGDESTPLRRKLASRYAARLKEAFDSVAPKHEVVPPVVDNHLPPLRGA